MIKHLSNFLIKNKYRYIFGILMLIFVNILQLIIPVALISFTDHLAYSPTYSSVFKYAGIILILGLGIAFSRYSWRILILFTTLDLEIDLKGRVFNKLTQLSRTFYNIFNTGDIMAKVTNDIATVKRTFSAGIVMGIDAIFISVMTIIIMMIRIDFKLTLISIIPLPFIALFVIKYGKLLYSKHKKVQESFSELSNKVQESFSGIEVIKGFNKEFANLEDFNISNKENLNSNMSLMKSQAILIPLVRFIATISSLIGIFFGAYYVINSIITIGEFVAFIKYLEILIWPMIAMGFFTNLIQRGAASLTRVNELLDEKNDLISGERKESLDSYSIEFKNLSFKYPGENIYSIKNISFLLEEGKSIGITGKTGSGKSTITNIITKLYNTNPGEYLFGGEDSLNLDTNQIRDKISIVTQDPFLFAKKIGVNIAFIDKENDIDKDKVYSSSKDSFIDKEIKSFPKGYDTYLGERGVNISGGQKQRTALARALYKDSPIIILDDSLSAIDSISQNQILQSFRKNRNKKSLLIISHRIATIKDLDHIIVLEKGEIIEEGNHSSLIKMNGIYKSLFSKQQIEDKIKEKDYV